MKKFKIYQLPVEHKAKFMGYDFVTENNIMPNLSDYNMVYEGEMPDNPVSDTWGAVEWLDTIYHQFNVNHPADFKGHSLSVSDVVELDGKYYYCDNHGWEEVTFPTNESKKIYIITADGVTYGEYYNTKKEADARAEKLNDEYYMHKVWNVEEVIDDDYITSLTLKNETTMKQTEKKVIKTTDGKVFNLCVESAKQSKNGYTFDLKEVWKSARLKYKMNKQNVTEAFEIICKEHEIRKGNDEGTFLLVELMPKKQPKPKAAVKKQAAKKEEIPVVDNEENRPRGYGRFLTDCEIINLKAKKLARKLYENFKSFGFSRLDATTSKEYKNTTEAHKGKADMNNLLYVLKVVEGVQYTGKTRIEAYQNFLNEAA